MKRFRIRFSDLVVVECEGKSCRKSKVKFPEAVRVAQLFRKHGNLDLIRDGKFLVGEICEEKVGGKRIDVLPDGRKLSKGFSLFASKLIIHDEMSNSHWDVLFENPSGSFSYLYTLDKIELSKKKKFSLVDDFEKCLPRLRRNLRKELARSQVTGYGLRNGDLILAMLILLKTRMRVGGEIYYKRSRHKGLTTLKKKNLKIVKDKVIFDFVGKDGVPQRLEERFGKKVVMELKRVLGERKDDDFVFLAPAGHDSGEPNAKRRIFKDVDFEACFERFCGERFYPHIVRSHFATREVERFLMKRTADGGRRTASGGKRAVDGGQRTKEARKFCLGLAGKLGHKKFSKKSGVWEESFEVTLHHYVRPDLAEKIGALI